MTAPPLPDPADREPPDGQSPSLLGPGKTVNGRYRIERELGRGGIGVVYLARDLRLHDMPVVIKCLLDDSTQNAWLSKKFLQEAEALTRIQHPGVVRVIDRDRTADGRSFFVMEFVKGASLRSAIRSTGLELEFAAAIVRDLGQALSAAHREGVLHRDLKPENVMLETLSDGEQRAKLIDFGIAKVRDSREGASTEVGTLSGSLFYLAPEQLLGAPASVASDIYAFAAVAYEMLTGRRPFNPDAPHHIAAITQLMTLQRSGHVVPPQHLRPSVSAAAQAIVLRGLAFDPTARLADARQFGDDLAQALVEGNPDIEAATVLRPGVAAPAGAGEAALPRSDVAPTPLVASARVSAPVAPSPVRQPPTRRRGWLVTVAAAAALGATLGLVYLATTWRSWGRSPSAPAALQKEAKTERAPLADVRTLTYAVTVQRDPTRFPGQPAVPSSGAEIFSAGDRVRLAFTSAQGGHLYIFNESPRRSDGSAERERAVSVADQQRRLGTTRPRPDGDDPRPRRRLRVRRPGGCREALDRLVGSRPARAGRDAALRQPAGPRRDQQTRPTSTPSTRSCGSTDRRPRTWPSTTTPA